MRGTSRLPSAAPSTASSTHGPSGRTVSFGKVADAAGKLTPPKDVPLKPSKDWTIAGKPLRRLDTPLKIVGKPIFGIDTRLPGMLYAAISACPVFGGKLKIYDDSSVQDMPGVKRVVRVGDNAVAVVADTWWRAKKALEAMPIIWDNGANAKVSSATIAAILKEGLDADQAFVGNKAGDAKSALAGAAKVIEAVYSYPYQAHATMEPMNATALYTADSCRVWCPDTNGEASAGCNVGGVRPAGRQMRRLQDLSRRRFRPPRPDDYVRQAVAIAKEMPASRSSCCGRGKRT